MTRTSSALNELTDSEAAQLDLGQLRRQFRRQLQDGLVLVGPEDGRRDSSRPLPEGTFECNLCGHESAWTELVRQREAASCSTCGSTRRMREVVHLATLGLLGVSLPLPSMPVVEGLTGVGMSDSGPYAAALAERMHYTNTWYHQEPRLDVTDVPDHLSGRYDLVISSDVLEHVLPPVQLAFDGVARLLRPGGVFVLTVPCLPSGATVEHYPDAASYDVVRLATGEHVVDVRRSDGSTRRVEDPVFHGGPGSTLEMRLFGLDAILEHLAVAGFSAVRVLRGDVPEHGIARDDEFSLPVLAYR